MALLLKLYDRLTLNDTVQKADLIFVMAGRMERKQYGVELYRAGVASRLVLSVGRFEVSKMSVLGLEGGNELLALRDRTPPADRHFFLEMDASGTSIERAKIPRWNTFGEVLALRQFLERKSAHTAVIISTDVHLRRVSLAMGKVFRGLPIEFVYCPVPARLASVSRDGWWTRQADRRFVLKEAIKLAGYWLILSMPQTIACRLFGARRPRLHGI